MEIFYYILLFVFGISLGSFSNVLIFRYNPEHNLFAKKSILGRSHCMHCARTLSWYELIPIISFLLQRGKCRSCKARVSFQYPLVECAGGAITAGIPAFLNAFFGVSSIAFFSLTLPLWYYVLLALWIIIFFILLLITVIDFRLYIIPNELNLALGIAGLATTSITAIKMSKVIMPFRTSFLEQYTMLFSPFSNVFANHLLGAGVGFLFFFFLSVITRGRGIGFGDIKLGFAMGVALGWPDVGLTIALSFIVGGLVSVLLMLWDKKNMKDKVPFAPFLVLGFILTFFLGSSIVNTYFALFHL